MTTKPASEMRLGELLLRLGLIDESQFEQAFLIQQQQEGYKPIGEILRELGCISRTTLRDVLHRYGKQMHLGKLLVKMGVISETDLLKGLLLQQRTPERLGKILVRASDVSEAVLADALSIQLTIPTIKPDLRLMDRELLKEVNANFLYEHRVVPVSRNAKEQVVTVIMEDPLDMETVAALEKIFRGRIEPALLVHGKIDYILDSLLDPWTWAKPLNSDPLMSSSAWRTGADAESGAGSVWKIR